VAVDSDTHNRTHRPRSTITHPPTHPPHPLPPDSEPELITDPTGQGAGCVLCKASDFLRGGFGDRTIMICDTCEREFHVDCLRRAGRCDLTELPAGDWYCSCECAVIRDQLDLWVGSGDVALGPAHSLQVRACVLVGGG